MNVIFSAYDIIDKKKRGTRLSDQEIIWFITEYTLGNITDYQTTALLMAMFIHGLNPKETKALTDAMLHSGSVLKFKSPKFIDKHSTGGVGDKASFILGPIAAACGVKVPMIAGRGLGFTGGTIDKIESVKGFQTSLSLMNFKQALKKDNLVLMGQTPDIAPADRLIYALRDVSALIDSVPLITASIMSKKLAEGANGFVFDIKVGSGAFMKTKKDAKILARSLNQTAKRFGKPAVALLTNMNQPLGSKVGNSLEIIESIETLRGQGPDDLTKLSLALSAHMIKLAGIEKTYSLAYKKASEVLYNGKALNEFKKLIKNQNGDLKIFEDFAALPVASEMMIVRSPKKGFIKSFQNDQIGFLLTELGGGRKIKTDLIDHGVGFDFHYKIGDYVKRGDSLLTIFHNKNQEALARKIAQKFTNQVINIVNNAVKSPDVVYETIK